MVLSIFRKIFSKNKARYITESHGSLIPWHKRIVLKPLRHVTLALPDQILGEDEKIGSVIHGPDEMEFSQGAEDKFIYLRIQPGMRVWLSKSCDAIVYSDDQEPVRFEIEIPEKYQQYINPKYK